MVQAHRPASLDTILNADAVEFCPEEGQRNRLICGTYQLEESDEGGKAEHQTRRGRLLVVKVHNQGDGSLVLEEESKLDVPGVFDIKWGGWGLGGAGPMLGHAAADGRIYTYSMGIERGLTLAESIDCRQRDCPAGTLALSLDWSDRDRHKEQGTGGGVQSSIAVSLSDGTVCIVDAADGGAWLVAEHWKAHDLEAWIAAWDCHSPQRSVLYTGADDGLLKVWDLRAGTENPMAICKAFDAGVTCIQSHAQQEYCLAVGSYDESVSIFDTRRMRSPAARCSVGGGVWRVKWSPSDPRLLLAACMHAGFTVLRYDHSRGAFDDDAATPFVGGHTSLGYGADWMSEEDGRGGNGGRVVGTASFYDHLLQVCHVDSSLFEK